MVTQIVRKFIDARVLPVCIAFGCLLAPHAFSAENVYIPTELDTWQEWVLAEHQNIYCPIDDTDGERLECVWISELDVQITTGESNRLKFRLDGEANADGAVSIPAGDKRPISIEVNGEAARVGQRSGKPLVFVDKGPFSITGLIEFENVPRSIDIPRRTAIVKLSLNGIVVGVPKVENGKLWLQHQENTETQANSLRLDVYRRLVDDIPQLLETRIRLTVDGTDRVEAIGKPIFSGFTGIAVNSDIPIQVTRDGSFLVQVSRGEAWLTITAQGDQVLNVFAPASGGENWPTSEIWVIAPETQHRTVEVVGVPAIDPILVDSPFGSAPTYRVAIGSTLQLENEKRGNPNPKPGNFKIAREIWLGFDGSFMVASDHLTADVQSEMRLSADYDLGQVQVNGANRLVTYLGEEHESGSGIALHPDERLIEAVSLLNSRSGISASGWQVDADQLMVNLNIPPGWKLLWTAGVDSVNKSWLSAWWNLWDIFICVLIVVVLYRVGGPWVASMVAVALLLSFQEHMAPAIGWLVLGLLLLLDTQLKSKTARRVNQIAYWTLVLPVAVLSLYVAANNLRQAVYPQLSEFIRTSGMTLEASEATSGARVIAEKIFGSSEETDAEEFEELIVSGHFLDHSGWEVFDTQPQEFAIQTGPGMPYWQWDLVELRWSGPVGKEQRIALTFLPPPATRAMFVAIALLHLAMLFVLIVAKERNSKLIPPWLRKVLPVVLVAAAATSANAQFPDTNLLDELETRLTAPAACVPGCASLERASLIMVDDNELRLDLTFSAGAAVAIPLPQSDPTTALKEVSSGGSQQPLLRMASRTTYTELREGSNRFTMKFELGGLNDLVIEFPLEPAQYLHDVCCWHITQTVDAERLRVVLNRRSAVANKVQLEPSSYQFHHQIVVERELDLQYEPISTTTVRIENRRNEVVSLEVPLLEGETVLDDHVFVRGGHAVVFLDPRTSSVSWRSALSLDDMLKLSAPSHTRWIEVWYVRGSDFWHFEGVGLTPSQSERNATVFKPRRGEILTLNLQRPLPTPGQTITVNTARLMTAVGNRVSTSSLVLVINASIVDDLSLRLPDNATVEKVTLNDDEQPLGTGSVVNLPLKHGESVYSVHWRLDQALGWFYRTPDVTLSKNSRNVDLMVQFPRERWVLLLGGPTIGSAVLFWGIALVTVLVALALTFLPKFPLTKVDAVLIAVGATLASIWSLLFVALWIVAVWWRARSMLDGLSTPSYRLVQVIIGFLTVIGVLALFITVLSALRIPPNMFIASSPMLVDQFVGYEPYASKFLGWFADESQSQLPTAWILSLPFWVYQLAMLAWSLWLVFALSKWVRATFAALGTPSFWRSDATAAMDDEVGTDKPERISEGTSELASETQESGSQD